MDPPGRGRQHLHLRRLPPARPATVRIHIGQGRDTRTDLYQDRRHYVWDNHSDTATLRNDRGRFIDNKSWATTATAATVANQPGG
jgi:hypothetical protein